MGISYYFLKFYIQLLINNVIIIELQPQYRHTYPHMHWKTCQQSKHSHFAFHSLKHNSLCIYLGVGPFGVLVPFGVVGPAELELLRTLGVEGVRGLMRGRVVEELVGVRGATRGWGVEGALVLADVGVWGAVALEVEGFPQPSRVLRVILRGWGLDLALGVLFFSSGGLAEGASLPWPVWDVGVGAELSGWVPGDEVLANFLPFFSPPLFGANTSRTGGSFSGVPSSPGEKDRKEQ